MATKHQKHCSTCANIDRDSYRGTKVAVCYRVQPAIEGKRVAIAVTDKRVACGYYKDKK